MGESFVAPDPSGEGAWSDDAERDRSDGRSKHCIRNADSGLRHGDRNPFLAVYLLASQHWDAGQIGIVMMIAGIATVAARAPAGAFVDWTHRKRSLIVHVGQNDMASAPTATVAEARPSPSLTFARRKLSQSSAAWLFISVLVD
jgi:hypothetical protein